MEFFVLKKSDKNLMTNVRVLNNVAAAWDAGGAGVDATAPAGGGNNWSLQPTRHRGRCHLQQPRGRLEHGVTLLYSVFSFLRFEIRSQIVVYSSRGKEILGPSYH